VNFVVKAAWWQMLGLWIAVIAALLLLIWFLYRWRTKQLLRNAQRLGLQVQLQTKELQLQAEQLQSLVEEKTILVTQLQEQKIALEQQARLDGLTGIANRRAFDESLQYECLRSSRLSQPLSLVLIDLDHFKLVNDQYSHLAGDLVLKRVSAVLQLQIRDIDTLARWGGEEFAILLPNTLLADAVDICERMRQQIRQIDCRDINQHLVISASFGIANSGVHGQPRQLIAQADAMLYQAKALGRNQVCS
jgi:diguanylate cyclase (GGDEF)-like protein